MSRKALLWKFILIGAVIVGAILFSYPPEERINLGLDLRGGAHIVMEVDTASAIKYQLDQIETRLGQRLKELNVRYEAIATDPRRGTLEIRGVDTAKSSEVRQLLKDELDRWQIDDIGSGGWRATIPQETRTFYETSAVDMTLDILRNRIDSLGVGEHLIQKQGLKGDRILLQLPGVEDPQRVKDVIGDPSVLDWKVVTYPPGVTDFRGWMPPTSVEDLTAAFGGRIPPDTDVFPEELTEPNGTVTTVYWPLKRVSTVTGTDLRTADSGTGQWGDPVVNFELTQEAGKRFEVATRENMGRKMAIVLGGSQKKRVISAPVINGMIRDRGFIEGSFTPAKAQDFALKLRSGAIPIDIKIIEERTVGPSLGRDSIRSGLIAGLVGFLGILVFMLVYYRFSGVNAVVALGLNVLLVFGAMGALPWLFATSGGLRVTLTLPGIAGLILTVGMAVDSNVLVFERIREELRMGKTVRAAVEQGFSKAFLTILDCHVTTLVSAFFLFFYGTGTPVQGFAVTLAIGLVISMFTAVFVSHQLFELVLLRKGKGDSISI